MKILPRTLSAAEPLAKSIDANRTIHRSVEITIEREFLAVTSQSGSSFIALCPACRSDVLLLTVEAAALAAAASPREIYRWLETGKLHFQELPTGKVFICSRSLKTFKSPTQESATPQKSGQISPEEPK
jgi:hypothetical protein